MMKTILLFAMCFLIVSLSAQNYTFTHGTFNTGGGHQANSLYSNFTAFGEYVVGDVSTDDHSGYVGFLFPLLDQRPPVITSIDDVPNDQGREVQIVWNKCAFDDVYSFDTFYSVWRLDDDFEGMNSNRPTTLRMVEERNFRNGQNEKNSRRNSKLLPTKIANCNNHPSPENTYTEPWKVVEQFQKDPDRIYYWQRDRDVWTFIDTIPALQYEEYALISPTLVDSNVVDINYSIFKVVYHDQFEYYESSPDSGYSIDNIAPDETEAYITKNGSNMNLCWEEVEYGTFQGNSYPEINGIWYRIYAGDSPDFDCDETTFLETVIDLNYNYLLTGEDKKFFKVVVSDQP